MASFKVEGLAELSLSFEEIARLPGSVLDDMLNAQGDVVVAAQKRTASTMLRGPYYAGGVAGSVAKGKVKNIAGGKMMEIEFKGRQHGESLARIAYINEYGKKGQPARPFIRTANEQAAEQAVEAAANALEKFYKSKGV